MDLCKSTIHTLEMRIGLLGGLLQLLVGLLPRTKKPVAILGTVMHWIAPTLCNGCFHSQSLNSQNAEKGNFFLGNVPLD